MAQTTLLGHVLHSRYRLEAGIGSGASADVYRALDLELDGRVAVKMVHPGLASDERFLRHFQGEARAVAALNHPNIVQIFDWGKDDDQPFLVLEYLPGGSLRDLLTEGVKLSIAEVTLIGAQTARALEFAHSKGIVHRDIKPANLLFDESGDVHITDFGLARAMVDATWTEHIGTVFGTARYASPEQASGENIGTRSDVYSLAIVCYEALVGEAPFIADTPLAMLMARTSQHLPTPAELPLSGVLHAAAAINPNERIDAAEFALALETLSARLPDASLADVQARRNRTRDFDAEFAGIQGGLAAEDLTVVGVPVPDLTAAIGLGPSGQGQLDAAPDVPRAKRSRRSRLVRWGIAAMVVVVLAGVGATLYDHDVVYGHTVPHLDGLVLTAARTAATDVGLRISHVADAYSPTVPAGHIVSQSLAPGTRVKTSTGINVVRSLGHAPVEVPKLAGLTSAAATSALKKVGLTMHATPVYSETVPVGTVVSTASPTTKANYGTAVAVKVSNGPSPRTIPELGGLSFAQARSDLVALRLKSKRALAYSNTVPAGEVISSAPAFGATGITVGTVVTVEMSQGPELVAVPTVAGEAVSTAVAALEAAGLSVTEEIGPPFATTVSTTDPAAGTMVRPGTDVTLYTS